MRDDLAVPLTVELMLCDLTWVRRPRVSQGHHLVPTVCFKLLQLPLTAFSPSSSAARSSFLSPRVDYVQGRMCVFNGSWSWLQHQLLHSPLYCLLMDTGRRPAVLVACGSFPMHATLGDLQRCLRGHGAMARRPVILSARRGRATLRSVHGKRAATVTFTLRIGCPTHAEPQLSMAAVKQQGSTDFTLKKRRGSCHHCHPEEGLSPTSRPSLLVPPSGESFKASSHVLQPRTRASTTVDKKHRHRCHCCQHPQEPLESASLPPRLSSRSSPSSTHVLPSVVMNTYQRDQLNLLADPALTDVPTQNSLPSGVLSELHHGPARIRRREVAIQTGSPQVDDIRRWVTNPRVITTGSRYHHHHHHHRFHQHHQRTLSRAQRHQQLTADRLMRGQPTSAVTSALVLTAAALPGITLTRTTQLRLARHLPDVRQELLAADLAARRSHNERVLSRSAAAGRQRYSPELYDAVECPTECGKLSPYPCVRNGLRSSSQCLSSGDWDWLQQPVFRQKTLSRQESLPRHSNVPSAALTQFSRATCPRHGSAVDRQLVQERLSCRGSSRDCGTLTRRVPMRDRALNTPSLKTRNVAVQWQDEQQHLTGDSSYDVVSETGPFFVTAIPDVKSLFESSTGFEMLVSDVGASLDSVCADPAVEDSVKKISAGKSLSEDAAAVVMPPDGVDYTEDGFESESISSDDDDLIVADHHIAVKPPQHSLQHHGSTLTSVSGRSGSQSSVNSNSADRLQEADAMRSANELRPPFTAESPSSRGDILEMLQSLNISNSSQQSSANSDKIPPTATGKGNQSDSSSSTLKGIYWAGEVSSMADDAVTEGCSPAACAVSMEEVSSVEDGSMVASVTSVESAGAVVDSGSSVSHAAVLEVESSAVATGAGEMTAPSLAQLGRTAAGWHAVSDGAAARWSSAYQLSNSVDDVKEVIEDDDGGDIVSAQSSSRVIGSATKGRLEMPDTVDNCGDASAPQHADDDDDDISARISRFLDQMGSLDGVENVPETMSPPQPEIPRSVWLKGNQKLQDSSIDTALTDVRAPAHVPNEGVEIGPDTDSISSYMPSDLDDMTI